MQHGAPFSRPVNPAPSRRPTRPLRRVLVSAAAVGCLGASTIQAQSDAAPSLALARYTRALSAVQTALTAHGGVDPILSRGVTLTMDGTFDLTTRLQGRSDLVAEPTPLHESVAIDAGQSRVAHIVRGHNYFHSRQHYTEVFDGERALFIDHLNERGSWIPAAFVEPDAVRRFGRYLPQLVLAEALAQRRSLVWLGTAPSRADKPKRRASSRRPATI